MIWAIIFLMRDLISEKTARSLINELKKIRQHKKISQYKIAKDSGLSTSSINSIENGDQIPSIITCFKICRAMNVKLWEVLREIE